MENPYIQKLAQQLSGRAREIAAVKEQGSQAVNLNGLTVQEILLELRLNGPRTVERLTKAVGIPKKVMTVYAEVLFIRGVVKLGKTGRRSTLVSLVNSHKALCA